MSSRRAYRILAGLCLAALAVTAPVAKDIRLIHREKVVLQIQAPTATVLELPEEGFVTLGVDPESGAETTIRLLWPGAAESVLRLRANEKQAPDGRRSVDLQAELRLPDGSKVHAKRLILAGQTSASLFEVYRVGSRALILTIESDLVQETVVPGVRAEPSQGVLFLVEVLRVLEGRTISLERNQLHSFIGEPVTYSFRLGDSLDSDSVRVEFTATRLMNYMIEIDVVASGTLPGDGGPQLVSRTEQWVASRGAPSTLAVESGDPPTGYRFVVTPIF